ncbi:hypothetical protein SAMN04489729_7094 [Amycolatopsis lurida]|uniref:Uncharacterized protein n=1 Tax=Amycolatopsis lurida NRRL 2430 TaxID=1460371 RepID=A0A2P2FER8_AMYLU|nr:hypothetical protein [Amycolatopsis lurida]KFU75209.1 hypothetical protein BB31_42790 [Amycolatopsis lurida NRRL 2430]SEE32430.1 hypothetical protein SAMN04489729_7094 [Amycolatopsis lurida]
MNNAFTAELHQVLLRLAGWLPDDVLARARSLLAHDRCAEVARLLAFAGRRSVLPLGEDDLDALAELLESEGHDPAVLEAIELIPENPPLPWQFSPDWGETGDDGNDEGADNAMLISALAEQDFLAELTEKPGVRGVWSTVRRPDGDVPFPKPRVIYVVEIDDEVDDVDEPVALAAQLQDTLIAAGERDPQVEIVSMHVVRPRYQRTAQMQGKLLWSPHGDAEIKVARVFDEVDPENGPRFASDHETMDDEDERTWILEYLDSGIELLVTTGTMGDIVDPAQGSVVPMNFRTDGVWVWTDTVTYYLETHHLAPDSELLEHIRAAGGLPSSLDTVTLGRAVAALSPAQGRQPVWTASGS